MAQAQEYKSTLFNHIDGQLDQLVDVTGQASVNARAIGNELDSQNAIIANTNNRMDVTQNKIDTATGALKELQKMKGTCTAWIVSLILLLIMIVFIGLHIKGPL